MLDLVNYEEKLKEAIRAFWGNREEARQKQIELGKVDQGERAGVNRWQKYGWVYFVNHRYSCSQWPRKCSNYAKKICSCTSWLFPSH